MNENPEGTPNPLNPNPEMGNTPDLAPEPNQMDELAPEPRLEMTDKVVESMAEPTVVQTTVVEETVEVLTPEGMNQPSVKPAEKKKSKKTMWIIVAVVALLVAIGCAVAALLILNPFGKSEDRVSAAITKLLDGGAPTNVATNGTMSIIANEEDSELSSITANFDVEFAMTNGANNGAITVAIEMMDGSVIELDVEEVAVQDGDFYFKIGGITESILNMVYEQLNCEPEVNCPEIDLSDMDTEAFGELGAIIGLIGSIEGEWIRIPNDSLSLSEDSFITLDEEAQCLVDALGSLNGKEVAEAYKANPFITSSTENLTLTAKKDTLYKLGFDEAKLNSFSNAIKGTEFAKKLENCGGSEESEGTGFSGTPTIYAEVDENNNFTRIYFDATLEDGSQSMRLDTSFSYPSVIEVSEPEDYTDFETILTQIFSGFTLEMM